MSREMGLHTVFVEDRATSRQLRKAKLVVVEGEDNGKEFVIDKPKVYGGRSKVNDITLNDQSISGTHFEIRALEEGFLLRDLGSTNGTRLGGCRIKEIWLEPDVSFRAGTTTMKVKSTKEVVEIPLSDQEHFQGVIGRSVAMREVFAMLEKVAPSELTCLIEGETGTGKERIARAIHDASRRKKKPYVVLDCSSIPKDLMESYVFGHEKGAFTGAISQREGAFEQANGGTLFLDEIGELDISLQPKLLRVLENQEFKRVGGSKVIRSDCRVIAATNRDLRSMVDDGTFREDLYFRLSIIRIYLPSLAERGEDIPLLVEHFLDELASRRPDRPKMRLTAPALEQLMRHPWPGNVRELRNVILRAGNLSTGAAIDQADLFLNDAVFGAESSSPGSSTPHDRIVIDIAKEFKEAKAELVERFEEQYLGELMQEHEGNISQASRSAGLTRYHLRELLKKYDLK